MEWIEELNAEVMENVHIRPLCNALLYEYVISAGYWIMFRVYVCTGQSRSLFDCLIPSRSSWLGGSSSSCTFSSPKFIQGLSDQSRLSKRSVK